MVASLLHFYSGQTLQNLFGVDVVRMAGGALNTLVQLDPIYVTFNASETDLTEIEKARAAGTIQAEVLVPGEAEPRHKGDQVITGNLQKIGPGAPVSPMPVK